MDDVQDSQITNSPITRSTVIFIAVAVTVSIGIVYIFFPKVELPPDPIKQSAILAEAGMIFEASHVMEIEKESRKLDIEFQRQYLMTHFMLPKYLPQDETRDDEHVVAFYLQYLNSPDENVRDIGRYLLGLFWRYSGDNARALSYYKDVNNKSLPYLNNSVGRVLSEMNRYEEALPYYFIEIELSRNVSPLRMEMAIDSYATALLALKRWDTLKEIIESPTTGKYVGLPVKQPFLLHNGQWKQYALNALTSSTSHRINLMYLFIALIGFVLWLYVIRCWVFYEPKPVIVSVLAVSGGIICSQLIDVTMNIMSLFQIFELRGDILGDLAYCVLLIGFLEEIVKFIPVFIIRYTTKLINDPVDWVICACLSALGFGLLENYLYLNKSGIAVALSRTFLSLPLHFVLSAFIGILIGEAEKRGRSKAQMFFIGYFISSVVHGLFDYMILGPIKPLSTFAFLVVLVALDVGLRGISSLSHSHAVSARAKKPPVAILIAFVIIWLNGYFDSALRVPFMTATIGCGIHLVFNSGILVIIYILSEPVEKWKADWFESIFNRQRTK